MATDILAKRVETLEAALEKLSGNQIYVAAACRLLIMVLLLSGIGGAKITEHIRILPRQMLV